MSIVDPPRPDAPKAALTFVRTLEDIATLAVEWQALEAMVGTARPLLFQSHAWIAHVARCRSAVGARDFEPLVAVWRGGDEIVAILPLAVSIEAGCRVAEMLDGVFGQLTCILSRPGVDISPLVRQLVDTLRRERIADVVRFAKVTPASPMFAILPLLARRQTVEHGTVVVDLRQWQTAEDFHAGLSKRTRRAQRNAWNRLRQFGAVELIETEEPSEVDRIIRRSVDQRMDWLAATGKTAPAFRDHAYLPMLHGLARESSGVRLIAFELRAAGEPLAMQWGFLHANRYYAYISSRTLEHDELSPGRLHLEAILAACIKRGIEIVELMSPASPYKLQLAGEIVPIWDYELPLTARGWLWVEVWRGRTRPALKAAYESIPATLRERVNRFVHPVPPGAAPRELVSRERRASSAGEGGS